MTLTQYTPNLQDDSDANFNDHAGKMIKMERGCDKVRKIFKIQKGYDNVRSMIKKEQGCDTRYGVEYDKGM